MWWIEFFALLRSPPLLGNERVGRGCLDERAVGSSIRAGSCELGLWWMSAAVVGVAGVLGIELEVCWLGCCD